MISNNFDIDAIDSIDIRNIRPKFNSLYDKFHGLQILLNDTENTSIELNDFSLNTTTHQWSAVITVTVYDHFGLDKMDAIVYQDNHAGFAAWWILQNMRDHVPFITVIRKTCTIIYNP